MSIGHLIALLVVTVDGGASQRSPSPEELTIEWLSAVARHDPATLKKLAAFPLTVDGFQSNDKPERNPCNGLPGMTRNAKTSEIRISAETEAQFDKMIACVLSDPASHEWLARPKDGGQFKARVRLLRRAEDSSRRLRRYRKAVSRLPKDQVLVEAVTDDDSVTVSALVVLRPVNAGSLAIEAVHIDFLFVE